MAVVSANALCRVIGVPIDEIPKLSRVGALRRSQGGFDLIASVGSYCAYLRAKAKADEDPWSALERDFPSPLKVQFPDAESEDPIPDSP